MTAADPILSILNETPSLLDGPRLLHELIAWQCGSTEPAIDFLNAGGEQWTCDYHELRACVSSLAAQLREELHRTSAQLEGRQAVIPLLIPQSPGLYISIFAILEAGAAFCPINLDAPLERIKFIAEDVGATIFLSSPSMVASLNWDHGPDIITIDDFPAVPEVTASQDTPSKPTWMRGLAYVMYTSGSTGTPKGVAVSHLAASQSLLAHDRQIPQFKRFLQFAAPSFDVSVFEIFFPLFRGATLVGCSRERMLNDLSGTINVLRVDGAELTPTVAGSLVQLRSNVPALKLLMTIGEMLTRPVVDQFGDSESSPGILYGMYGPTEAAIHCTINPLMKSQSRVGSIGVPFDTTSTFVIAINDSSTTPSEIKLLPIGETGELVLGGPQLADGYLNRPEQNEAAFITLRGQRAYRTGDKARMLKDGTIEVLGRISSGQVKLRGQRVELGEIEEVIYKHENIKSVIAMVVNGILVAFALQKTSGLKIENILEVCNRWLPKFMVPSEVVLLEEIPYLPSGKVDKKKLEADYKSQSNNDEDDDLSEQDPTESAVREVLNSVLGANILAGKRLSTYGLDSIVAIRLSTSLRVKGFMISPVQVLQADTLASLMEVCEEARCSRDVPATEASSSLDFVSLRGAAVEALLHLPDPINTDDVDDFLPCTPIQDAMLLETALDRKAYLNEIELHLSSPMSAPQARQIFSRLAQHNSILRTGFLECDNVYSAYTQIVWKRLTDSQFHEIPAHSENAYVHPQLSLLRPLHVNIQRQESRTMLHIKIHHALYDAWSLELFLDDLDSIISADEVPTRPPFRNVLETLLSTQPERVTWSSRQYWNDHLRHLEISRFSNFHPVTDVESGLKVIDVRSSIKTSTINQAARIMGVSAQSLFQSAYALILSSYLGKKDVCFGTVFSGRTIAVNEVEQIAGPCLTTLPIRLDISDLANFEELVQRLNAINRKHLEHSPMSLRDIKNLSNLDADRFLFDSLLIWQQTLHDYEYQRDKVMLVNTTDYLEFNLTLEITPTYDTIKMRANYQQALFPQQQITILLEQIEEIVVSCITSPKTGLKNAFDILSSGLLSTENTQVSELSGRTSLFASVVELADSDPERPAIDFAHIISETQNNIQSLTYRELNSRANQIAHVLTSTTLGTDELVCICMEKSPALYISILGSAKAGAGYLPITPETPIERIKHILLESNVKVVLTCSKSWNSRLQLPDLTIIMVDSLDYESLSVENVSAHYRPDSLAYCIYTSGSTGVPKGVLVTQKNLASNLQILRELYPHLVNMRLLQSCSQAFDVSVFEIFFTWYVGGCLCSAVKDVLLRDIEQSIRVLDISHLSLTPTVAALIDPANVPSVKFLVTAGEALSRKVFNLWAGKGLYQGYGPSETTNICTVRPNVSKSHALNNIGRPFHNTSAYVINPEERFQLVPRGGIGELCLGGLQVGRGYLNPSQAIGSFFDHPEYGRLYRSGDIVRLLFDGSLSFCGRRDDQVKIRGHRIELGEINYIILKYPEVYDCISIVTNTRDESEQLINFWTASNSVTRELRVCPTKPEVTEALYSSLKAALPAYMIPSALIQVSHLPSTSQGKIDKRRLLRFFSSLKNIDCNLQQTSDPLSPHTWTETEQSIRDAVTKVCTVPNYSIGPDTSFFELGLDSISAISLARFLRRDSGLEVEISEILRNPSIARLSKLISTHKTSPLSYDEYMSSNDFGFGEKFLESVMRNPTRHGQEIERIAPCTPLQEVMLSSSDSRSDKAYYNHSLLALNIDSARLDRVWTFMIKRHEILRTYFITTTDSRFAYAQVTLTSFRHNPTIVNCKDDEIKAKVEEMKSCSHVFDEGEPPYRLTYIKTQHSLRLLLSMHHALYDGFAMSVLLEEMEMKLHGRDLPPPVSFTPFLHYVHARDVVKADYYWDRILKGLFLSPFSELGSETVEDENTSSMHDLTSRCKLEWIERKTKSNDASLLAVCQAAWAIAIAHFAETTDVCFGNVVSGRTTPIEGLDRLVAPCFNTIPVRVCALHKLSFMELFRQLQTQNTDCMPFQLTPLRRVQSRHGQAGMKLFDTVFLLQPPAKSLDPSIWILEKEMGVMDVPVILELLPRPEQNILKMVLHAQDSYISSHNALKLLEMFDSMLEKALTNPQSQALSAPGKYEWNKRLENQKAKHLEIKQESQSDQQDRTLNALELQVCSILARFTDVPLKNIARNTSIYRLGLDSVNAVQIAAALRKEGHTIVAGDVLQNPTVKDLANLLQNKTTVPDAVTCAFDFEAFDRALRGNICSNNQLLPAQVESILPCTPVQSGMLAQTLHSCGNEYVNSFVMKLNRGICLERLRSAWSSVAKSHIMLRAGFAETGSPTHPFAIIIYTADFATLPWTEVENYRDAVDNMDAQTLVQSPWKLEVFHRDGEKMVKFTAHHAIYDAQSLDLILSDVAMTYSSSSSLQTVPVLPLLSAIIKQSEDRNDAQKKFWQGKIMSITRFPDLTPLHEASAVSSSREIQSALSFSKLEHLCKKREVTVQAVGQATWARLLSAYVGENTVTFGVTLSGRSILEDSDNIAFPSLVTLPITADVSIANQELLQSTMDYNSRLHSHQFTPLTSIQRWTGSSEGRIFDTLFAYQKIRGSDEKGLWTIVDETASADYVVSMELLPLKSNKLLLRMTCKENVVPADQIELLLRQFDSLLIDTIEQPSNLSSQFELYSSDLQAINPAKCPNLPCPVQLLHEFVALTARDYPYKVALEFATSFDSEYESPLSWTYQQLEIEGNKIADLLQKEGLVQKELVAICFEKCPEASFAILGILKAGCAYVALDPSAPPERWKFILEDSKSKLVLTNGQPFEKLKRVISDEDNIKVLSLGNPNSLSLCSNSPPVLREKISPEDTCYCLYTSGTTGTPKGCEITHENAVQAMMSFQRLFDRHWTSESKWLQFASFHFDVSVLEQFWSWSVGICVTSAPRDLIFEDIPEAIRRLGVTHIDLTPSLARLLHPDDVPSLCRGVFITGGEKLRQDILDVWGEHSCIYNGYGPTEATIGVTMYPRVPKNGKPSNIGPQFDNVGSFVLKPGSDIPVLRGAVGELCVSGKLVGKGYLNRPELTKERFQYLERFKERVYRTGDLVRILHDGSFLFLGRADDQVKLRGQRLELTEINEVIKKNASTVQEVVTLVLKHAHQEKEQLVAFFVLSEDTKTVSSPGSQTVARAIAQIREACHAYLPGYMIPTHFIPLDCLPLSANNKADSKQLAKQFDNMNIEELHQLSNAQESTGRWNEHEEDVIQKVSGILSVEVSVVRNSSTIFELGIDSISILGFARSLQKAGYENAKTAVLMQNPSITSLVKLLTETKYNEAGQSRSSIDAMQRMFAFKHQHTAQIVADLQIDSAQIEALAPCTATQQGMIYRFLDKIRPLYFSTFDFQLNPDIDIDRLRLAWSTVMDHLQILRTRFALTDDGYAQVVIRNAQLPWHIEQLVNSDEANLFRTLQGIHSQYERMEKSSALLNPYKITIVTAPPRRILMSLTVFHALYDGMSLPMIFNKVYEEYCGIQRSDYGPEYHSILPFGPLTVVEGAKDFWSRFLSASKHTPLAETQRSEENSSTHVSRVLGNIAHLTTICQSLGVTAQAVLLAAWATVLSSLTESNSVTFGLVLSGRSIDVDDVEKVIGPLFNTVPFSVDIKPNDRWKDLILQCHQSSASILPYQHTPLKDIQKWVHRKIGGNALFDCLFVFQGQDESFEARGLWKEIPTPPVADYPLAFEVQRDRDDSLTLTIVAQNLVVNSRAGAELLDQVESALRALESFEDLVPTISSSSQVSENNVQGLSTQTSYAEPTVFEWSPEADKIRSEIAALLGTSNVDADVPIFTLGLDSIDVIKLSSRLKRQGINLSVSVIVKAQTIVEMVKNISPTQKVENMDSPSLHEYENRLRKYLHNLGKLNGKILAVFPATPLQEGMISEMRNSRFERYFNHEIYQVREDVDLMRLRNAWEAVIEANDILRTTFVEVDDVELPISFAQVVHQNIPQQAWHREHNVAEGDLEAFAFARRFKKIIHQATQDAIRGKLFQLNEFHHDNNQYFVLSIAHALYDGWSLRLLHSDVQKAYQGEKIRHSSLRIALASIMSRDQKSAVQFWKNMLVDLPISKFPCRSKYNMFEVHRGELISKVAFPLAQEFCRNNSVSLQTLAQAAWAILLAFYSRTLDIVFGAVLSGRESDEENDITIPLMNTIAVRTVIHGSIKDMLRYMQDNSNNTRIHQHFPLRKVQALAGRAELFDTLFIFQGHSRGDKGQSGMLYKPVQSKSDVEFLVCVEMEIIDNEIIWRTACKDCARTSEETDGLLSDLDDVLQRIIGHPSDQIIASDGNEVSLCGLPKFQDQTIKERINGQITENGVRADEKWTGIQMKIRHVLSNVSKVPEEGIDKDQTIFHLGLDSISAIKVSSILRKEGIRLRVNDIMTQMTVRKMADFLMHDEPAEINTAGDYELVLSSQLKSIDRDTLLEKAGLNFIDVEDILPVTAGQLYMICREKSSRGATFFASFRYRTSMPVDRKKLETSWRLLQQRNPILRTIFLETTLEEQPFVQIILKNTIGIRDSDREASDQNQDSLLCTVSLMIEDKRSQYTICLRIHHALYDAVSLPLILDGLGKLYFDTHSPLSTHSFHEFVAQSIYETIRATEDRRDFWTSYFENTLPRTSVCQSELLSGGRIEIFRPSIPLNITAVAQRLGLSVDSIIVASFGRAYRQIVLPSFSDAIFGLYMSNRAPFGEDLSKLEFPTLNLLPIRVPFRDLTVAAEWVQKNLQLISSSGIVGTSLQEIWQWTGVKIDCFLNLLKSNISEEDEYGRESVHFFEDDMERELRQERKTVVHPAQHGSYENVVDGSSTANVFEAYLPSIDVEMRLTEGGKALDIGIFAPYEMLSLELADELIHAVVEDLRQLS